MGDIRRCYQGVQLSPLGFAACQSKNCTNLTNSLTTLLVQLSLRGCSCLNCTNLFEGTRGCTCRLVGAVETTAPPEGIIRPSVS